MNSDQITNFLSGYFHEDWEVEAETDADVVALLQRSGIPSLSVVALADELEAVATERESEASDEWLLKAHGCYYQPSADGLSGSDWLRHLAALMRNSPPPPDSPPSTPRD
jgi:hypothetical protein